MAQKKPTTPWVASVPIVVSDRKASLGWYTEGLGLQVHDQEGHWVTVGGPGRGTVLHLCQASENQPAPIPLEPGPSGIVIAIPGDFRAECEAMRTRGVEFTQLPVERPWGWYASVRDPDGNEHYLSPAE